MTNVYPIRTAIQLAGLELYHKYSGRYWFANVKVEKGKIFIFHKKNKPFYEWLGNDDTYKSFKYAFLEQTEDPIINTRLKN